METDNNDLNKESCKYKIYIQNTRNDFHFNSASIFDDSFMLVVIVGRERERKKDERVCLL